MKLLTYIHSGQARLGALLDGRVIDLTAAYATFWATTKPKSAVPFPADMVGFLQGGDRLLEAARAALDWAKTAPEAATREFTHRLDEVRIGPPVGNPSKIMCIGLNYHDHCREQNVPVPSSPIVFVKFPSALTAPDEPITWPPDVSKQVDYEAELAVVFKRAARNVAPEDAYDTVAGYTILNDVSARDVQFGDKQWVRGKSFDTFCPCGPYLVTADEVGDPQQLAIQCRVNGEVRQDSNTNEMIFKIPELIAFISKTCTILPGDILSTGTPDGVGVFRKPPVFLKAGDVVEVEIEKLGTLRNPVVAYAEGER